MKKVFIISMLAILSFGAIASPSTQKPVVIQIQDSFTQINSALSCSIVYAHTPMTSQADYYKGVVYERYSDLVEQLVLSGQSEEGARQTAIEKIVMQTQTIEQQINDTKSGGKTELKQLLQQTAKKNDCVHYANN
ncbi:hypothetical protein Q4591_12685 [Shewanella sp. 3_MG-2023]|uniref:hypothetical protein n=1 Tax=Shewanella sp. 3_MG-2023 TaxID=3062635 RepID=UPI0026E3E8D9|nr:hypothetical protein [Shewanella sp. 3_MG-2023]MDO6776214.1 hypothetical protein [Shewanella sp. 3_MG-2023]